MNYKTAAFLIKVSWRDDPKNKLTPTMLRDKLLMPLQELWITHVLSKLSLEEVEQTTLSRLEHGDTKGTRESFYKTGFPKQKETRTNRRHNH